MLIERKFGPQIMPSLKYVELIENIRHAEVRGILKILLKVIQTSRDISTARI